MIERTFLFSVKMTESGTAMYCPSDFVKALIDCGHDAKVCQ